MSEAQTKGEVITFYSYKGGTGRSMALSNVACLLADRGEGGYKVLMVDWDLEAPGLHKYFPPDADGTAGAGLGEKRPGLIDLFTELERQTRDFGALDEPEREAATRSLLDAIDLGEYVAPTSVPSLDLISAGCSDGGYSTKVNTFRWEAFYQRVPWLISMLAGRWASEYRYVLVDSRTGLTDISGICTTLLPEKLVVVFTPNAQSLGGVLRVAREAASFRRQSDDLRKLVIFPLASRVEITEPKEKDYWRLGTKDGDFKGYQVRFEEAFASIYGLERCDLTKYFAEVEIPHAPFYAYGEKIAVLLELTRSVTSFAECFERLTDWLTRPLPPWDTGGVSEAEATQKYFDLLLRACDIVELSNLPEIGRHLGARQIELRRLFLPRRVRAEAAAGADSTAPPPAGVETDATAAAAHAAGDAAAAAAPSRSIGEQLKQSKRFVMLTEPGAGKTVIMRWIVTAYLLRLKQDPTLAELPGADTLPEADWLPILVRCRDLDTALATSKGGLDAILPNTLRRLGLTDEEVEALSGVFTSRCSEGRAILLFDGLDEIVEVTMRARFTQLMEQLASAYPETPIVVSSRLAGYREAGYRLGREFEHVTLAELSSQDKDDFARRWCELVEPPERREEEARKFIRDIHSVERVERLTDNPMLLTLIALARQRTGLLPLRRSDLYWQIVSVQLSWRSEVDEPLDDREAVPHLEYVAYAMCERGVSSLHEDEILELFEQMRERHSRPYSLDKHTPEQFLRLVERRTGLLVEAGTVRYRGRPARVFQFRHRTLQEYFAALAIVGGCFPGRDPNLSLAATVAEIAGRTLAPAAQESHRQADDTWPEVLRLCVMCCDESEVDAVLLAILQPQPWEGAQAVFRRAMLAALCLADDPPVGDETARRVLSVVAGLAHYLDLTYDQTWMKAALDELRASKWGKLFGEILGPGEVPPNAQRRVFE